MSITLVTSADLAVVWLVRRMNVRVLFTIRTVGKTAVTTLKFTLKRLLTCKYTINETKLVTEMT